MDLMAACVLSGVVQYFLFLFYGLFMDEQIQLGAIPA